MLLGRSGTSDGRARPHVEKRLFSSGYSPPRPEDAPSTSSVLEAHALDNQPPETHYRRMSSIRRVEDNRFASQLGARVGPAWSSKCAM